MTIYTSLPRVDAMGNDYDLPVSAEIIIGGFLDAVAVPTGYRDCMHGRNYFRIESVVNEDGQLVTINEDDDERIRDAALCY